MRSTSTEQVLFAIASAYRNVALKRKQNYELSQGNESLSAANLTIYGNITGSQIQVATQNSCQTAIDLPVRREIQRFLFELESSLPKLHLELPQYLHLAANVDAIRDELKTPHSEISIIKSALKSLKRILEGAGGALLAQKVAELVLHL